MAKRKTQSAMNGVCEERRVDHKALKRAKSLVSPAESLNVAADAFKVLGHPARLKVLEALDGQELCVCDLSEILGLSMSGTSQQLRELRRLGAINYRASGKFAYYRLVDKFWLEFVRAVLKRLNSGRATQAEGIMQAI